MLAMMVASCGCSQVPPDETSSDRKRPSNAKALISCVSRSSPDSQASTTATANRTITAVPAPALPAAAVARAIQRPDSISAIRRGSAEPRRNIPIRGGRIAQAKAVALNQSGTPSANAQVAATTAKQTHDARTAIICLNRSAHGALRHAVASLILTPHQGIRAHLAQEAHCGPRL